MEARSRYGMRDEQEKTFMLQKGPRTDRFLSLSLFISLLNEAATVQEPLDVGQTVAFLAADG